MRRLLLLGIVCVTLTGCYTLRTELRQDEADDFQRTVYLSEKHGKVDRRFEETEGIAFSFWGASVARASDPSAILSKYLRQGYTISNLRITTERTFSDSVLTGITLGLYSPWTVRYTGDLVRLGQ